MPFGYDPDDALSCFPDGDYTATIESVEEKTSKAGNPMLVVNLKAYSADGNRYQSVRDWVVNPGTLYKLKQIAHALGEGESFQGGTFDLEMFVGRNVRVALAVEESIQYGDQNRVRRYIGKDTPETPKVDPVKGPQTEDDDCPF